jgi:hypothetical protein
MQANDRIERLAFGIKEAAVSLGISERKMRDIASQLPCVRIGMRVLIPVDSLREWLLRQAKQEGTRVDRIVDDIVRTATKKE